MTADEFVELRPSDLEASVIAAPREHGSPICLLERADPTSRAADAAWDAVAAHLHLVNLVRARIGQRPLGRRSGYTPADIKADAEFYAATQTWARQRARELGLP